ncbi:nucleoside-diphosphate kinase [Prochlorococcus marinus CUG1415]|nr:nucleoside-diphosphate kinase [Prochlorococcus marinus CUG1415]MBW3043848.1 nucleoside-diphosphate kinase [Prochlorococcus marinus str. MU1415]
MADLNIPNLNKKSDKYIFKKKLSLRRKSKKRLFTESAFMFFMSLFLVYINYLIPNKNMLFQNLPINLNKSFILIIDLFSYLYDIFLVIFLLTSTLVTLILLAGSLYRLFRITKRKTRMISYK